MAKDKRPKWWRDMADAKRLEKLKNRSDLHKAVVREIRKQFGYDNVAEFVPMKDRGYVTFRDIWINQMKLAVRFYDNTPKGLETKDWFEEKARCMGVIFIDRESTFDEAMEAVGEGVVNQINYLNEQKKRKGIL